MVSYSGQIKPELCLGEGVLPSVSYIGTCHPIGFAHFGLELGMVFEGTTGEYVPWVSEVFSDMRRGALLHRQKADTCSAEGQRDRNRKPRMKSL